jgi:hypothetical protein
MGMPKMFELESRTLPALIVLVLLMECVLLWSSLEFPKSAPDHARDSTNQSKVPGPH